MAGKLRLGGQVPAFLGREITTTSLQFSGRAVAGRLAAYMLLLVAGLSRW
jgi:hypothetical protein